MSISRATPWIWMGLLAMIPTTSAWAAPQQPDTLRAWYVQEGFGESRAYTTTLGVNLPWPHAGWKWGSGQVRGHWDVFAAGWSGRYDGHRRNIAVIGAGPSLRWRGQDGMSPWFWEIGTALTYANRKWRSGKDVFSTRFNFATHFGVGYNFGPQRNHEVSLRIQHASNAGIKSPNPGADFVLVRYARRF